MPVRGICRSGFAFGALGHEVIEVGGYTREGRSVASKEFERRLFVRFFLATVATPVYTFPDWLPSSTIFFASSSLPLPRACQRDHSCRAAKIRSKLMRYS